MCVIHTCGNENALHGAPSSRRKWAVHQSRTRFMVFAAVVLPPLCVQVPLYPPYALCGAATPCQWTPVTRSLRAHRAARTAATHRRRAQVPLHTPRVQPADVLCRKTILRCQNSSCVLVRMMVPGRRVGHILEPTVCRVFRAYGVQGIQDPRMPRTYPTFTGVRLARQWCVLASAASQHAG